jgi:hypothetical protein
MRASILCVLFFNAGAKNRTVLMYIFDFASLYRNRHNFGHRGAGVRASLFMSGPHHRANCFHCDASALRGWAKAFDLPQLPLTQVRSGARDIDLN